MNKVAIFTDSTADLGNELYEKRKINFIPFSVAIDGKDFRDSENINSVKLFELVKKTKSLPKTAAASPDYYLSKITPFIEKGYDIFFVGIGKELSTAYNNVLKKVNEMLPVNRFYYIDGMNLSSATGLLLLNACDLRDSGKSAKEIAEILAPRAKNVFSNFSVFTYDYLKKGGRVTHTKAFFATLLKIKPILGVRNGLLKVRKLSRGKFLKSLDFQIDELEYHYKKNNVITKYLMITHAVSEAVPYILAELKKRNIKFDNILETPAGAVIASHCGPGTIGILYEVKNNKISFLEEEN